MGKKLKLKKKECYYVYDVNTGNCMYTGCIKDKKLCFEKFDDPGKIVLSMEIIKGS